MVQQSFIILINLICIAMGHSETGMEKAKEYYRSFPEVDFGLADAVESDVIYKHFSSSTQDGKVLTVDNVRKEITNKTLPTVLLIHGWTTDDTSPWYSPLKSEYFKQGPHNIIYINWSKAGNKSYDVSSANVKPVGKFIAQFLIESGVRQEKIQLIGHSLGSHLASFVGKSFFQLSGKQLGRITALDPAGPKFEVPLMKCDSKLCVTDAEFVDVIHTDIQMFGYTAPIGHVDFYPNDGQYQPGCPPRAEDDNCSHARSTLFFIESISKKSSALEATFEEKDNQVTVTVKNRGNEVIFGQHVDKSARGIYYIKTQSQSPYLQ